MHVLDVDICLFVFTFRCLVGFLMILREILSGKNKKKRYQDNFFDVCICLSFNLHMFDIEKCKIVMRLELQ